MMMAANVDVAAALASFVCDQQPIHRHVSVFVRLLSALPQTSFHSIRSYFFVGKEEVLPTDWWLVNAANHAVSGKIHQIALHCPDLGLYRLHCRYRLFGNVCHLPATLVAAVLPTWMRGRVYCQARKKKKKYLTTFLRSADLTKFRACRRRGLFKRGHLGRSRQRHHVRIHLVSIQISEVHNLLSVYQEISARERVGILSRQTARLYRPPARKSNDATFSTRSDH